MDTHYGYESSMFGDLDCHAQTKDEMINQLLWDGVATSQLKQNLTDSLDLPSSQFVPISVSLADDDSTQTADALFWSAFGSYTRLSDPPDNYHTSPNQSLESSLSYQTVSNPRTIIGAGTGDTWAAMGMSDNFSIDSTNDKQYNIDNAFIDDSTPLNSLWNDQLNPALTESHHIALDLSDGPILKPETCSPQDLSLNYNQEADVRALFPECGWPIDSDIAYSDDQTLQPAAPSEMQYPPLPDGMSGSAYNYMSVDDNLFDGPVLFSMQDHEVRDPTFKPNQLLVSWEDNDIFTKRLLSPQSDMQPTDNYEQDHEQLRSGSASRDVTKDEFLLRCKAQGMSYKEIKARGNYQEAESTLRGRYRTLTKSKEQRVRKPVWSDLDITTLKQVVAQYLRSPVHNSNSRARKHELNRVPWKLVAENMANRGCYRYGNATVKKKYFEAMGIEQRSGS